MSVLSIVGVRSETLLPNTSNWSSRCSKPAHQNGGSTRSISWAGAPPARRHTHITILIVRIGNPVTKVELDRKTAVVSH